MLFLEGEIAEGAYVYMLLPTGAARSVYLGYFFGIERMARL
jgi:hypothetical protein